MSLKKVIVENSVGMVLAHDITQIIPGVKKGPLFRKGYIVTEKDIPQLLTLGKEHLYVWEQQSGWIHEDEAANRLANAATGESSNFEISSPKEGRVNIASTVNGLLKIDTERLTSLNSLGGLVMVTVHTNRPVQKGEIVAGTRVIPLIIEEEKLLRQKNYVLPMSRLLKFCPTGYGMLV